ncbi:MAG: SMC-Scp complex subunit ScpB [Planctomycetaceae bacterium]|nr:SMC-Scp complex subunit ScpB [Planctomycetaceae bacterium]
MTPLLSAGRLRPSANNGDELSRHANRSGAEFQRYVFRRGPLFELNGRIDNSQLLPDGRLIRSNRLARLEAVLLISDGAVTTRRLVQLAGLVDTEEVEELIGWLNISYDRTGSAFRIERTANGFQMLTHPALVSWLDRLHQRQSQMKLSQPAMETLTIIAYRQPVTRAGIESIRGAQATDMIRQLIDRGLIRVGGEEDSLGKPFLYVTTRKFLDMFGLGRIEDLPDFGSLVRPTETDSPETACFPEPESELPAANPAQTSSSAP